MILQIEHEVLQLTQRADSHQDDSVHWTTGSKATSGKVEQPIFCQGVGELQHPLCDRSLQVQINAIAKENATGRL